MSFFSELFKREPDLEPLDLSVFGTDFHSHLIPGIDDGAATMNHSIAMIKEFKALGYKKIITTPHVMYDFYKNTPEIILKGLDNVREELAKQNIDIEIEAAAEYNLDDGLDALIKSKKLLTFGDNYVLFELPFISEPRNLQQTIFDLQMAGYKPILAHPERYSYWHGDTERYEELRARGVLLQLNLLSLTGHYSVDVKKIAEKMVANNLIDGVGSDCHRIEHLGTIAEARTNKFVHQLANQENLINKKL